MPHDLSSDHGQWAPIIHRSARGVARMNVPSLALRAARVHARWGGTGGRGVNLAFDQNHWTPGIPLMICKLGAR